MQRTLILAALASITFAGVANSAVLVNGGFEDGSFTNWMNPYEQINPATVAASFTSGDTTVTAYEGTKMAVISGTPSYESKILYFPFATLNEGDVLTAYAAGVNPEVGSLLELSVRFYKVNEQKPVFEFLMQDNSLWITDGGVTTRYNAPTGYSAATPWTQISYRAPTAGEYGVIATAINGTLLFDGLQVDTDYKTPFDYTSTLTLYTPSNEVPPPPASVVPEPASWALMIMGFGSAGALMRRRRAYA
jgi:hypothetical protein